MPRQARIDISDTWYHIIARGHNRKTIFFDAEDYAFYLNCLETAFAGNAVIGAYCLMPNHVHLLVNRRLKSLGNLFRKAHGRYGRYFNQKYSRVGYVFQNRFKSFLVLRQDYLDTLIVYIHNNPVRAGLCRTAEDYQWSTDTYYRNSNHPIPKIFRCVPGFEGKNGQTYYRQLTAMESIVPPPCFRQYIGREEDLAGINRRSRNGVVPTERRGRPTLVMRAEALTAELRQTLAQLQSRSRKRMISRYRKLVMSALYQEGYSPTEIGNLFNRTPAAVIRAAEINK